MLTISAKCHNVLAACVLGTLSLVATTRVHAQTNADPKRPDEAPAVMGKVDNEVEMRRLAESTFGRVLLFDPKAGIVIGAKTSGERVDSASINEGKKCPMVSVEVRWRDGSLPPEVEYSVMASMKPLQNAVWRDVNGDGVFDFRLLVGNWPQFNNETGPRALIDGKWVAAGRESDNKDQLNHPSVITTEGKRYQFDFGAGKWVPAAKQAASPATQPAR